MKVENKSPMTHISDFIYGTKAFILWDNCGEVWNHKNCSSRIPSKRVCSAEKLPVQNEKPANLPRSEKMYSRKSAKSFGTWTKPNSLLGRHTSISWGNFSPILIFSIDFWVKGRRNTLLDFGTAESILVQLARFCHCTWWISWSFRRFEFGGDLSRAARSEHECVFFGETCLLSISIWLRTSSLLSWDDEKPSHRLSQRSRAFQKSWQP